MEMMPPPAMGGMGPGHMEMMPPGCMGGMGPDHMANMPPEAMGGMGPGHMEMMPPGCMGAMTGDQMGMMPPDAWSAMPPDMYPPLGNMDFGGGAVDEVRGAQTDIPMGQPPMDGMPPMNDPMVVCLEAR